MRVATIIISVLLGVSYLVPNWSAPKHVKAFSTTRLGGVSSGVYESMNLGTHVGDDSQLVMANRHKLSLDLNLPNEPMWLDQVHSAELVNADFANTSSADGAFSSVNGTVCVVMTADCLPLLLTNKNGDQVAAVHAGWRGMASGIIENAVGLFDCPPADIMAWAGPSIGPDKFEIGIDVLSELGGPDFCYKEIKNNKLLANLYLLCEQRLKAVGVTNYSYASTCTYLDKDQFFSYRRDGQCGRMASLIWIGRDL